MKLRKSEDSDDEANDKSASDNNADDADDEADNSQRVVKSVSPDLKTTLQNAAVDEVCTALIDAWDEDHIHQLCDRLRDHFTKPDIPTPIRRPFPQPTL